MNVEEPNETIIRDGGWTYTLDEELGRGGFATVYRATMQRDGVRRRVAVKRLHVGSDGEAELVARLRDEARILSRLEHHAIVRVLGVVEIHGSPAVVMDLVDGVNLAALIRKAGLPPRAVCQLGADIASALDAAWSDLDPETGRPLEVIHRDVKPANILLTRRGAVRLVDFGVARANLDRDGTTRSLHQFGTSRYMAPECFDNETTHRSDVYALAITLIESLLAASVERLPVRRGPYRLALEACLRPLYGLEAPIPWTVELVALLEEMMHYDERRRPAARDVADRLSELADEAPGEGLRRVVPARVGAVQAEQEVSRSEKKSVPSAPSLHEPRIPPRASDPPLGSMSASPASPVVPTAPRWVLVALGALAVLAGAGLWLRGLEEPIEPVSGPEFMPAPSESVSTAPERPSPEVAEPSSAPEHGQDRAATTTSRTGPQRALGALERDVEQAGIVVAFRLSAGAGGTVVVDSVEHLLPWESSLSLGLHAVTFRHADRESSKMIYVGESAPKAYVFDSSTIEIHAFK